MDKAISYGTTDVEVLAKEIKECREIVASIMNFGVTERQIVRIMYFLSMELENRDLMLQISDLTEDILSDGFISKTGLDDVTKE